ncbi:MAG: transglutaminase domain-containing protein, partial [Hominenteromicrobium sp.]
DRASAEKAAAVFEESPYRAFARPEPARDGIQIAYSGNGSADAFDEAAKHIVESAVYAESNELETALGLYRAVSSGFAFEESENNSLYRIMTEQKGGTAEFAAALNYLFNQNGIPSRLAGGTAADDAHFWVIAELDGRLYHFDPTFENGSTGGTGLMYFGMSDDARARTGCALPYTTGCGDYAETHDALCPDTKFDAMFIDVTGWTCDVREHFLYLAYGFETDCLTSVSTDTFTVSAG